MGTVDNSLQSVPEYKSSRAVVWFDRCRMLVEFGLEFASLSLPRGADTRRSADIAVRFSTHRSLTKNRGSIFDPDSQSQHIISRLGAVADPTPRVRGSHERTSVGGLGQWRIQGGLELGPPHIGSDFFYQKAAFYCVKGTFVVCICDK